MFGVIVAVFVSICCGCLVRFVVCCGLLVFGFDL